MISEHLAERYVADGWWDGSTLARGCAEHALDQPEAIAVVDRPPTPRVTYSQLWARRVPRRRVPRDHGVRPGDVVSVQLPNWYETVVVDLGVLAAARCSTRCCPTTAPGARATSSARRRASRCSRRTSYRGFDHAALGRELRARSTPLDAPRRRPRRRRLLAHVLAALHAGAPRPATRPARRVSELIFTSGTEASPRRSCTPSRRRTSACASAHAVTSSTDDDVVWMPSPDRALDRLQLRRPRRALPRAAAGAAGPVGRRGRRRADRAFTLPYTLAATTFLRTSSTRAQRRPARPVVAALLRLRRRAGAARARRRRGRARRSACCGCTAPPRCSS